MRLLSLTLALTFVLASQASACYPVAGFAVATYTAAPVLAHVVAPAVAAPVASCNQGLALGVTGGCNQGLAFSAGYSGYAAPLAFSAGYGYGRGLAFRNHHVANFGVHRGLAFRGGFRHGLRFRAPVVIGRVGGLRFRVR